MSPDAFLLPVKPTAEHAVNSVLNNKVRLDILIYFLAMPERRARILFRVKEINLLQAKKQVKNRPKNYLICFASVVSRFCFQTRRLLIFNAERALAREHLKISKQRSMGAKDRY